MEQTAVNWTEEEIQAVWDKGEVVARFNPHQWKKDDCGAWMSRRQYGNRESDFGWEIDRIVPAEDGGTNDLSNLRPLHWANATSKKDGQLVRRVTAYGGNNIIPP